MTPAMRVGVATIGALTMALAASTGSSWGSVRKVSPAGWDTDLSRCVRTPHKGERNYYQETAECSSVRKNWTLVVQAESGTLGQSCVGPTDQSFLVNAPGSPVRLGWIPRGRKRDHQWTVNLKVDTATRTVCPNQYTFFGFMNHVEHGGGPLPRPSDLRSSHELSYQQFARDGGEARLTLGAQAFWNGKAHILELLPARIGYNANPGFPPGVIQGISTPKFEYVLIDDTWGTSIRPNGSTQSVTVNWSSLFARIIDLGLFTRPNGDSATQGVYVAVETHNRAIGNLYQSKFRILGR